MNYSEIVKYADVVMRSGNVPLIIGEAGIGKSQIAKDIANRNGMELVNLYGSLIKEGELNEIY